MPKEIWKALGDMGLFRITVPEEDGGLGLDPTSVCIVHEELSKEDPGATLAYLAHTLLFVNNFYNNSTPEQRARWLEPAMSGERIGCMCMTEPDHGTDVLGMQTTATPQGDRFILNGAKTYITNAPIADLFLVYAKVDGRVTAFVLERGMPGLATSEKIRKVGMRASTMASVYFEDVEVPRENVLGEVGGGTRCMMQNLEIERLALAAQSVGIARRCLEVMTHWAVERRAFGRPIHEFGQVQRHIAEAFAETEAAAGLVYHVAQSVGLGENTRVLTDAAKLFAAQVGKRVADSAMQVRCVWLCGVALQVLGGAGYTDMFPVERLWRDAKLIEIGGGTLESHQKNITRDLVRRVQ